MSVCIIMCVLRVFEHQYVNRANEISIGWQTNKIKRGNAWLSYRKDVILFNLQWGNKTSCSLWNVWKYEHTKSTIRFSLFRWRWLTVINLTFLQLKLWTINDRYPYMISVILLSDMYKEHINMNDCNQIQLDKYLVNVKRDTHTLPYSS